MLLLLFGIILGNVSAQSWLRSPGTEEFCAIIDTSSESFVAGNYSPNGKVFTPKGTIRVLVIYAGFSKRTVDANNDSLKLGDQPLDGWPNEEYKEMLLPLSKQVPTFISPTTGAMPTVLFQDTSQFATYCIPTDTTNKSISRYYYEMSNGKFKLIGDVFKDSTTGYPIRVNVDPTGVTGWHQMNAKVINKMKQMYRTFDWSPYDNRRNMPKFQFSNDTTNGDMKPDYVIIVYRYSVDWPVQPFPGANQLSNSGAYSVLDGLSGINYNGYTFDGAGYTAPSGGGNSIGGFVHELGHELFSGPHYMGGGACAGNRFYMPHSGWGMVTAINTNAGANAWERWLLGWTDVEANGYHSNIESADSLVNGGVYTLRDFLKTGDAIRIRIPGTNQHLWIENHQKKTVWDYTPWGKQDVVSPFNDGLEEIPNMEKGVYMFVEDILSSRDQISTDMVFNMNKVGGIRIINAQGNHDYTRSDTSTRSWNQFWRNRTFSFTKTYPNPISGINPLLFYPDDFPANDTVNLDGNGVAYIYGPKNGSMNFYNSYNGSGSETFGMQKESNGSSKKFLFGNIGGRNYEAINYFGKRSDAFQAGDSLTIATNPTITNFPIYNESNKQLAPYYLNGLAINIISQSGDNIVIKVRFKVTKVNLDTRWAGNIILKDITGDSSPDVDLQSGKTITIDKSGIANRHTKTAANDFINPTIFTCSNNSYFKLNSSSDVIVDNGSTLKLDSNAKIEINSGAVLTVRNASYINLYNDAQIIVKEGGKILIEKGSTVQLNGNAKIILEDPTSFAQLNSTLELKGTSILVLNGTSKVIAESKGKIHVKDTAQFNITANAELQYDNGASVVLENTKSCLGFDGKIRIGNSTQFTFTGSGYMKVNQSTGQFIPGSNSSVRISGSGNTDQIIDIADSATLTFHKGISQLTIFNGKITMDNLSKVSVYCKARVASTKFTSWDGNTSTHKGLNLYGQGGVYVSSCTFEKGANGIYNSYKPSTSRQGGKLYISSSVFQNLATAYYQYGGGFGIFNSEFRNNDDGIITNITEVNSELNGCEFDGNTGYAIRFIGTGTASLSLNGTDISGSAKGIFSFGNSQTNIKCGTFTNNTNSVFGYFDPSFNLSSELNKNGTVTFNNEGQIFSFYHAGDLFLAEGFNNFFPTTNGNNEIINGTQNRSVPSGLGYFNAFNNDWNGSGITPVYSSDYEVTSSESNHFSDPIYYQDADPITSAIECGTGEPCTSCDEADLNPLKNCDCETINTTHIIDVPLNTALQIIIDDLSTSTGIDDREESVVKLKELLTYSMSAINDEERFLLKYAYRMFKDELALCISDTNFVDSTALSANVLLSDYFGYFSDILSYQKDLPSSDQLFEDISILKLDEALSYKLLTDQSQALDKTDDLLAIVEDIKDPYIAYWVCLLTNEVDFKAGTINQDQFELYTSGCWAEFTANYEGMNRAVNNNTIPNTLKSYSPKNADKEGNDATNQNDSENSKGLKEVKQLNIYPNPTSNSFTLSIPEESANTVIRIYNMYGKEVLEQIITNKNNVNIDLSNQADGYYICSVITSNSKYEAKIVKIK